MRGKNREKGAVERKTTHSTTYEVIPCIFVLERIPPYVTILRQQAETTAAVKNVPSQLEDVLRERAEASASVSKEYIDGK